MGYTGMVMSDDLGAADATQAVPVGDRAVRFVRAGGDLVLTIRPEDAAPMSAALIAAARADAGFADRLADAARHVLQAKDVAGLLRCGRAG
jgi:beta-N-acetylhexosaminidase